jgi:hypothetical protein
MLKFIHKKHIGKNFADAKLVIYYNLVDIILGFFLIILVAFFIYNYLEFNLFKTRSTSNNVTTYQIPNYIKNENKK